MVKLIHSNTSIKDSLFEQAQLYFATSDEDKQALHGLMVLVYLEQKGISKRLIQLA